MSIGWVLDFVNGLFDLLDFLFDLLDALVDFFIVLSGDVLAVDGFEFEGQSMFCG